jgi:hypothetical protein
MDEENAPQNLKLCKSKFPDIEVLAISAILEEGLSILRQKMLEQIS